MVDVPNMAKFRTWLVAMTLHGTSSKLLYVSQNFNDV
jgi:hypothetical protein